jgi:hypothetical protein
MGMRTRIGAAVLLACAACGPNSVAEAEAKRDVAWLEKNGSPEAMAALGRLADADPRAEAFLSARAPDDPHVYHAAWEATERGAAWGPKVLKAALESDRAHAEQAAAAMKRGSPALLPLADDLVTSLSRGEATDRTSPTAGLLASLGAAGQPAVQRALSDGRARAPLCRAMTAPETTPETRATLLEVPPESRDSDACLDAVLALAQKDDAVLDWAGRSGEVGVLRTLSKNDLLSCERTARMWRVALEQRPATDSPTIAAPLAAAIFRCAREIDPVVARGARDPKWATLIAGAVDPFAPRMLEMRATCAELADVRRAKTLSAVQRERLSDALAHGCRGRP